MQIGRENKPDPIVWSKVTKRMTLVRILIYHAWEVVVDPMDVLHRLTCLLIDTYLLTNRWNS